MPPVKQSPAMTAEELLKWPELKIGDMIQFNLPERTGSKHHWAIYAGDGQVFHHTTNAAAGIHQDSLVEYAGKLLVGVNNWADNGYVITEGINCTKRRIYPTVRKPEDIRKAASEYYFGHKKIGRYHFFENNCEYFATTCRYGVGFTGQGLAFERGWVGWTVKKAVINPIAWLFG